ncbi:MAG: hypothetical protein J0M08_09310 [Bacteroidetes bacterium]|nr:hypothetical protein [Bacteroidota bacterium]
MIQKLTIAILLTTITISSAQKKIWFDVGVKGGYGVTLITNGNIWNDRNIGNEITPGYCYGGKIGINFNESHEVTIDIMSSSLNQLYKIKTDSLSYNKTVAISTLNFLLLYRHHAANGSYAEIGPQLSLIQKTSEKNSIATAFTASPKNYYTSNYYAAVFGFGGSILGTDNATLLLGCRFTYALSDILTSAGGKSTNTSYPFNDGTYITTFKSYKPLKPLTAMLVMEFNFDLGYFSKSSCKRGRHKFLLF